MKRVAVVGGGIFGTTAAIYAARAGHEVHLFEAGKDLLMAASGINQYRLHRGYHYPRSSQTARSVLEAEKSFIEEYGAAILSGGRHLYAIAKERSLVTGEEFLSFCDEHTLSYKKVEAPELVNPDMVEFVVEVPETRFDPDLLRDEVHRNVEAAGVVLHLNTRADAATVESFDKVIIAAYANMNCLFSELGYGGEPYQFEICEKPVVTLPEAFSQTDLVIMDGPFMCVDPLGTSGRYVLGNVVHAIHATNVGTAPVIPAALAALLNAGIVENPDITRFNEFIQSGSAFIPMLKEARHVGSMFTIRTVLPKMESTDARPTLVSVVDQKFIKIFSGKIGNCVLAAKEALALI